MSIGPMGGLNSAAGSQLPQTQGTDLDKAKQDTSDQARRTDSDRRAENAASLGETEQDEGTQDRDADGRRILEITRRERSAGGGEDPRPPKDPTGQSGSHIDLSG